MMTLADDDGRQTQICVLAHTLDMCTVRQKLFEDLCCFCPYEATPQERQNGERLTEAHNNNMKLLLKSLEGKPDVL